VILGLLKRFKTILKVFKRILLLLIINNNKMPDYSKSKIYKIVCNTTGLIYIGSTIQPLCKRLSSHVADSKNRKDCTSREIIKNGNYQITLLEDFCCDRKEQLLARERYFIQNNECINKIIPTRTPKEYRKDNSIQIREQKKEHYNDTRDTILNQKKEYYANNAEKIKQYKRDYNKLHNDKINARRRELRKLKKEQKEQEIV